MRILVTGATGFIGTRLVRRLVEEGHSVRALARESSDVGFLRPLDVEIVRGDVLDAPSVERAARGCAVAYHLAAARTASVARPSDVRAINVEGTHNVARAALRVGLDRLVHASSTGIYGAFNSRMATEDDQPRPNSPYRLSKWEAETLLRRAHRDEALPIVIARVCSTLGAGARRWLPLFRKIGQGRFRLIGRGTNLLHPGHVDDMVDGLRRAAAEPGVEGETYNLAGPQPLTSAEFMRMIAAELDTTLSALRLPSAPYRARYLLANRTFAAEGPTWLGFHPYEMFLTDRGINLAKAGRGIGFDPQIPVRRAIRDTIAWYREQGHL